MPWQPNRLLSLCVAVIVVGFTLVAGSRAEEKPVAARSEELAQVGDAQLYFRYEMSRAWHGPESALLKKVCQAHPIVWLWEGHGLEKALGLRLTEIDHVTVFADKLDNLDHGVIILTTREPFNRDKVVKALVPDGKEIKIKEQSYFASEKAKFALTVRGERSLAIAKSAGMEAFLTRKPGEPGALKEAVTAAPKTLMTIGLRPESFLAGVEKAGKEAKPFVPLFHARSWQLTAEGPDDLLLKLRFTFANEEKAKEAQPALTSLVAPIDGYLAASEAMFPDFLKREAKMHPGAADLKEPLVGAIQALRAALKDLKPVREGPVVRVDLRIKTKTPATTLLMIATLLPRPEKLP